LQVYDGLRQRARKCHPAGAKNRRSHPAEVRATLAPHAPLRVNVCEFALGFESADLSA
jgi:hypothetical protein